MANPWEHFTAEGLAAAAECPIGNVRANWPKLVEQMQHCGINERLVQIGMIGTIAKESASSFAPVREGFFLGEPEPAETHRRTLSYYPFYGRGFIQNTHRSGYASLGPKIAHLWGAPPNQPDFNLVANPDNLLNPDLSAAAAAIFFRDTKTLQGYSLVDACRAQDWEWVRRLVLGGPDPDGAARLTRIAAALGGSTVPKPLPFNPDAPCDIQPDDWSCSIQSAQWLLRSIGRNPGDAWMHDQLVPGIVSTEVGLQDASGRQLAAWVTAQYGADMGFVANAAPVAFDDVLAGAGRNPTMIGGRAWGSGGHWAGVRRADATGLLELANPAPNYTGVGSHLDRAEWDARGPWTAIYIDRPVSAPPPPPPPPPVADTRLARALEKAREVVRILEEARP